MRAVGSHRAERSPRAELARIGRSARSEPVVPIDRLARFAEGILTNPDVFGGGADRARVAVRAQTVAYGYLGVVEGYVHPDTGAVWSTLTVTLPCAVPAVTLEHRSGLGRPGVAAADAELPPLGEPGFDAQYVITSVEPATLATLFTGRLCQVLVERPIQRLTFDDRRLLLRTFDGVHAGLEEIEWLDGLAADVLAATPAFVIRAMGAAAPTAPPQTFPPGLYG